MRNSVTTYRTKRLLADTLKSAMQKKAFARITVSDIVKTCGVNRKTFYYHFTDIYALLGWIFEEETKQIVEQLSLQTDPVGAVRAVMDHVEKNDYLFSCVYDSIGRDQMKQFFYGDIKRSIRVVIDFACEKHRKDIADDLRDYAAKFYTEACAGMLIEWMQERKNRNKEKTVQYLETIIRMAIESIRLYEE